MLPHHLCKSTDAGADVGPAAPPPIPSLTADAFINGTFGWDGRREIANVEGWLHSHHRGGATWSGRVLDSPWPIRQIEFLDKTSAWAREQHYTASAASISRPTAARTGRRTFDTGDEVDACDIRISATANAGVVHRHGLTTAIASAATSQHRGEEALNGSLSLPRALRSHSLSTSAIVIRSNSASASTKKRPVREKPARHVDHEATGSPKPRKDPHFLPQQFDREHGLHGAVNEQPRMRKWLDTVRDRTHHGGSDGRPCYRDAGRFGRRDLDDQRIDALRAQIATAVREAFNHPVDPLDDDGRKESNMQGSRSAFTASPLSARGAS